MKLTKSQSLIPTTLLEQLVLVFVKSESGPTMNAHEFLNCIMEFDLSNPYILNEEEIIRMLDKRDNATDNEPIEEVDNVQKREAIL
jgi:hypothetical protein